VGWDYNFDLELKKGVLTIHLKIQLAPTDPKLNAGRRRAKLEKKARKQIERHWDRKMRFHRKDCKRGYKCNCPGGCCLFPIRVKVSFVSGGGHVTIALHPSGPVQATAANPNPPWWNCELWFERDAGWDTANRCPSYAHEFGHNIGLWDEYVGGSVLPAYANVPGSIMCDRTRVMKHHFTHHPSVGESIHKEFEKLAKDTYKVLVI
jgi:hypothetical protein